MWLWDYFWKEWEAHTGSDEDGYDFSCLLSAPPGGAAGLPAPLQLAAGCIVPVRGAEAALGNDS